MILNQLSIQNYKNIEQAYLTFSPRVNCLIGNNGMGKTNILDAIYYLSFCKSHTLVPDSAVIRHGETFMMLQGDYKRRENDENITMGLQQGKRKVLRRNGKEYQRFSQHIGLLPLVMISPSDWDLIRGTGEERRRFMNQIISQSDKQYLEALIRYNKALEQRNSMIRHDYRDPLLYETVEDQMCQSAGIIHNARESWLSQFEPIFMRYYNEVAGGEETVQLALTSSLNDYTMHDVLERNRQRDFALGFTSAGIHRDDIELSLNGFPMRKTGSQGQCTTYTIAMRLAQFEFLRMSNTVKPILLLDDVFDRLDANRVERIINVVATNPQFGQIFVTDTNRTHLDEIIARLDGDDAMFLVDKGNCTPIDKNATTI